MEKTAVTIEPVARAATVAVPVQRQDTKAQLRLQTDKRWRQITIGVLLSFAFIDTLGTVLFLPAGGILCQLAEGGPMEGYAQLMRMPNTTDFKAIGASQSFIDLFHETDEEYRLIAPLDNLTYYVWDNLGMPKAFKSNPTKFSTAMNLLNVVGAISGAIGAAFWGWFSDKFGRKVAMLICHGGGLAGYVLMYVSGVSLNSYWGYFFGLTLNGLFSGAYVIVMAYFLKALPKEEQEGPVGILMSTALLGGGAGALVLIPFIGGRAENVFSAAWIGIGLTIISFVAVCAVVTEPKDADHASFKDLVAGKGKEETKQKSAPIPPFIKRILTVTIVGSLLDSAGDEGTRIARGTLLQNIWPTTNTLMFQNAIILSLLGMVLLTLGVLTALKKAVGIAPCIVLGASATLVSQVLFLIRWEGYAAWLGIWYTGKFFGFMSTFGSDMVINQLSPEDAKGTWQGISAATSQVAEGVATLCIALLYDHFNDGSDEGRRGKNALYVTIAISSLAVLAYLPLLGMVPKEVDEKARAKKFMSVEEYEALTAVEAGRLPLAEVQYLEEQRAKDGKPPKDYRWGTYADEHALLEGMIARSGEDFEWMKEDAILNLTDPARLKAQVEQYDKVQPLIEGRRPDVEERHEMGKWIADYLDDAGYESWKGYPAIYKAMLINAFPPIDKLDNKKPQLDQASASEMLLKFLKVADAHIVTRRSYDSLPSRVGVVKILNKLKRR